MVIISFLPQEIIIDIFTRLPLKSIGRCRCVSNSWRTFLSHTNFQHHSLILLSGTGSLFTAPFTVRHTQLILEPLTKLSFHNYSDSWDNIYAVCGGLVLVENKLSNLFLVNPVTAEIRKVPALPYRPNLRDCYNKYGVGYDSVNDDYKLVILSYYAPCLAPESEDDDSEDKDEDDDEEDIYDKCFVNVFSVRNGVWSKAECSPYSLGHDDSPIPGVYVKGYIHWIAYGIGTRSAVIASFDLVTETFSIVPPPRSWGESTMSNVVDLGGDLCVYDGGSDYWIMKEYRNKDSWIHVKVKVKDGEGDVRPLCMLREKEMVFVKDEEAKLVKYDLEKETWEDITVIHTSSDDDTQHGVGFSNGSQGPRFCREAFVESLVSPHSSLD